MNGWILVNKPSGITSFQVVKKIRNTIKTKVGHCGTLDPIATGFLLLAVGQATKLIQYAVNFRKQYYFRIKWGTETDTLDCTGKIIRSGGYVPTQEMILKKCQQFIGDYMQKPPIFSAIKINGKRAYKYAREGIIVQIAARKVQILSIKLISHIQNLTTFYIKCSKGFYIRSFAKDIAQVLNTYAHVESINREIDDRFKSHAMIDYTNLIHQSTKIYNYLIDNILPLDYILSSVETINITAKEANKLSKGQKIKVFAKPKSETIIARFNKKLIAVCKSSNSKIEPKKVFKQEG